MARCGLRDAFVWLCKSETIEDHVLYYATVISRCTSQAMSLENASVAFAMCIVQQLRSRYRLYVVRGRLHSTVCMARCGLRNVFVWLCKSETMEDHVLYVHKPGNEPTCGSSSRRVVGENIQKTVPFFILISCKIKTCAWKNPVGKSIIRKDVFWYNFFNGIGSRLRSGKKKR